MNVVDLRKIKNSIFNYKELDLDIKNDLDLQIYNNFRNKEVEFINQLKGSFAFLYDDNVNNVIFAVRDWIGEVPLHYIVKEESIYFANFIEDLRDNVPGYKYDDVVALNRSELLVIDKKKGIIEKKLYYNFNQEDISAEHQNIEKIALDIHDRLLESTKLRFDYFNKKEQAVLLSGGIDSMSVAYFVSLFDKNIPAYTLQIGDNESTDVIRARMIAKHFGLEHRIIKVPKDRVLACIDRSIESSEIFHLYNVFCAIGMDLMAETLKNDGILYVHTGEGGNECFGDYYDWIIYDEKTNRKKILQTTSEDFKTPLGREAYVWGNLVAEKKGRYNAQLGSGLGKHGGSRMYKPMYKKGITLLSPYFDKKIMKILTNISVDTLKNIGGKPGFMSLAFKKETEEGKIPKEFFDVKKIRLQDASEDGAGDGLTETLLRSGYDQKKIIELFNNIFQADVKERQHLKETILVKEDNL
ncbi:MAG: hypothetical protein KAR24_01720 [Candidatus Pacebacteria bacterium]|nr:hypothetical protein [Candidatus Paceibacterota bacterium]